MGEIYVEDVMYDTVRTTYCKCGCECRWTAKGRDEDCPECGRRVDWSGKELRSMFDDCDEVDFLADDYTEPVTKELWW